jgi:hypothetical protein
VGFGRIERDGEELFILDKSSDLAWVDHAVTMLERSKSVFGEGAEEKQDVRLA